MSTADRERYLDAFKLMGEVDTETGKEVGEGNTRKLSPDTDSPSRASQRDTTHHRSPTP